MGPVNVKNLWWWGKRIVGVIAGFLFLVFGVEVLIGAYRLQDPFNFVLSFFAANLIILISLAIAVGLICQMVIRFRRADPPV